MMRTTLLILVLTLTACGKSDEQRKEEDKKDVAMVEAAQNRLPPIKPVALGSLLPEDRGRIDAVGGRCSFAFAVPDRSDLILVTMGSFGWIKLGGALTKLAADTGSDPGPARTWTHYTGLEISLRILPAGSSDAPAGSAAMRRPVRVIVRDALDRVLLTENLVQSCTS